MSKLYFLVALCICSIQPAVAQTCTTLITSTITTNPNTYFPANQATVSAGATSINLGAATSGTISIIPGDVLLVIQMQGAQINSSNSSSYGSGGASGAGYLSNGNELAGNMEYVVASNLVPLTGGTLNLTTPLVNSYKSAAYGTDGQYTYQVIRVPMYYNLSLGNTIMAPSWNGKTGGVLVLFATNNINLNGQTVLASGTGFRGGAGRQLTGGSGSSSDYVTLSTNKTNGSKGEGIAGSPTYINNGGTLLNSGVEGYPNGSYSRGAPGNAGGGGTDGNPSSNNMNAGGGGGGNGGAGGNGGNAWSSNAASGGKGGAVFGEVSGSRLVLGGGGGAGTNNDGTGTPSGGIASSGAAGGGLVIIISQGTISGTGYVFADGGSASTNVGNDGAGGGGGGGSILIFANSGGTGGIIASAAGGNGGTNEAGGGPAHGPGGGGGGGVIYSNGVLGSGTTVTGGSPGLTAGNSTNYNAANGSSGKKVTNMSSSGFSTPNISCIVLSSAYIDLSASLNNGIVHLNWDAIGQATTQNFVVEKSTDGTNFSPIGTVQPNTPATAMDSYKYNDDNTTAAGMIYYRIVMVQTTGNQVYSRIVPIQLSSSHEEAFTAFPNPTMGAVTVRFYSAAPKTMNLRLFNLQGAVLWQQEYSAGEGINTLSVGRFSTLPEGLYILNWTDGQTGGQVKVMVRR